MLTYVTAAIAAVAHAAAELQEREEEFAREKAAIEVGKKNEKMSVCLCLEVYMSACVFL